MPFGKVLIVILLPFFLISIVADFDGNFILNLLQKQKGHFEYRKIMIRTDRDVV